MRRQTVTKRLRTKLKDVKETLMRNRHEPLAKLGDWLGKVVRGYLNYHAIPGNIEQVAVFRSEATKIWYRALKRRSQRCKMTWGTFGKLVDHWLPKARIMHPYPNERFYAKHPK